MKKFWWLFLGLFIMIVGGWFYFRYKYNTQSKVVDRFIYNQATQKWEEYKSEDIIGKDRETIIEILAKAAEQLLLSL